MSKSTLKMGEQRRFIILHLTKKVESCHDANNSFHESSLIYIDCDLISVDQRELLEKITQESTPEEQFIIDKSAEGLQQKMEIEEYKTSVDPLSEDERQIDDIITKFEGTPPSWPCTLMGDGHVELWLSY